MVVSDVGNCVRALSLPFLPRQQGSGVNTQEDGPQCAVAYFLAPSVSIFSSFFATNGPTVVAVAGAWLLTAGTVSSISIASVSTPLAFSTVDVEPRFGAAGSGGAGCPSWALASIGPSSPANRGSNRAQHRLDHISPPELVPALVFSLPSNWSRKDCSSASSNDVFIASQSASSHQAISGLGQRVPNRLSEYRHASCVFTSFESRVPSSAVSSHGTTAQDPSTVSDQQRQQWRLNRDLHLRFLSQVDTKTPHQPTDFLVRVLNQAHPGWGILRSTLDDSLFAPGVLNRNANCWFAIDAEDHLFPPHASKCSTTADTTYVADPFSSTLIAAIMPRAMSNMSKIVNSSLPGASCMKE